MISRASKIYVAGHQGLVGSALVRELMRKGYTNLVVRSFQELDARNQLQMNEFFATQRPEYVFFAAAKVGGIGANATYKAEFIYDNIMIASNVIHAAYLHGVKKLINFGSSCIYPKYAPQPLKEEYLLSGPLEPTNEPYAIAKIAAIKLCRYYNEQYGTNFMSLMPTNLYGPHDNFNLETAHVMPALIRKFHLAKLLEQENYKALHEDLTRYGIGFGLSLQDRLDRKEIRSILQRIGVDTGSVTLWGSGSISRELLYVDDLAQAALMLAEQCDHHDIGECINVGTGIDCTIRHLAEIVRDSVGYQGNIHFDITKPDGTPRKCLNVSKLEALGWRASISLEDGIGKVYSWYVPEFKSKESYSHVAL
jgi:GDP-L-fucose synthase